MGSHIRIKQVEWNEDGISWCPCRTNTLLPVSVRNLPNRIDDDAKCSTLPELCLSLSKAPHASQPKHAT